VFSFCAVVIPRPVAPFADVGDGSAFGPAVV
jgi:hypothetical protein